MSSALENAIEVLLAERNDAGYWEGELSTSALSTAVAVVALHTVDPKTHQSLITSGLDWLVANQNEDGGWGDTTLSFSNISTSLLCWAACGLADLPESSRKAERYIASYVRSLDPDDITEAIKDRYGKDRTFSVPILMCCAICGRLGNTPEENWKRVLPLPFELAAFPRKWFAALQLPVVSYALPALIAIGHARFFQVPPGFPPLRWLRNWAWKKKASQLLSEIQPPNGGFLEATPLTSFVTMALASSGQKDHPVVEKSIAFIIESRRTESSGTSWPIDTNLATWGTTLAMKALHAAKHPVPPEVTSWVVNQQYRERHPFTDAPPGGWAWTDLPGGVPDGDDTPGALIALHEQSDAPEVYRAQAEAGLNWLINLQNRDGGIPTFCRGWGALPFDRSSPDLTAHALRAFAVWEDDVQAPVRARIKSATAKGLKFLKNTQHADGSWTPLWFGNQHRDDETNPTYGTAMVALALPHFPETQAIHQRAKAWLRANQNEDGGWGAGQNTPSSIEETALAVAALDGDVKGKAYLISATENGTTFSSSPIGFYFAKLWYFERLYPIVWTISALATSGDDDSRPEAHISGQ